MSQNVCKLKSGDIRRFGFDFDLTCDQNPLIFFMAKISRTAFIGSSICLFQLPVLLSATRFSHNIANNIFII